MFKLVGFCKTVLVTHSWIWQYNWPLFFLLQCVNYEFHYSLKDITCIMAAVVGELTIGEFFVPCSKTVSGWPVTWPLQCPEHQIDTSGCFVRCLGSKDKMGCAVSSYCCDNMDNFEASFYSSTESLCKCMSSSSLVALLVNLPPSGFMSRGHWVTFLWSFSLVHVCTTAVAVACSHKRKFSCANGRYKASGQSIRQWGGLCGIIICIILRKKVSVVFNIFWETGASFNNLFICLPLF